MNAHTCTASCSGVVHVDEIVTELPAAEVERQLLADLRRDHVRASVVALVEIVGGWRVRWELHGWELW